MARKIAVNYLKQRSAKEVYVKLAYVIGQKEPVQAVVEIDGVQEVVKGYDLTPQGIIDFLRLNEPIFSKTAE
jgi:S-adenosylmethionine synthetase